ncbi:hypothetical protein [Caproicibacter fermentans]|uniref:hypothetical protein n=1 Tax=Caproicibacter fermentans TaxID=2576756 RepID=UPI0012ED047F|nr:hypothetical protein [Caproicibacter fermentans]
MKGAWRQGISSCSFLALLQKISKTGVFLLEIQLMNQSAHEPLFHQGLLAQSLGNTGLCVDFFRDEP